MKIDEDGNKIKFPLSTDVNQLENLGVGIKLYFKFLSYFSIVFFIMTLLAIPQMYYNWVGESI